MIRTILKTAILAAVCSSALGQLKKKEGAPVINDPAAKGLGPGPGEGDTTMNTETSIHYTDFSDVPTDYETELETETVTITRVVTGPSGEDGDCKGPECFAVVELSIRGFDATPMDQHQTVVEFVEVLDIIACRENNGSTSCDVPEPIQLVDYYTHVNEENENKTVTTLVLTICNQNCTIAFLESITSRAFSIAFGVLYKEHTGNDLPENFKFTGVVTLGEGDGNSPLNDGTFTFEEVAAFFASLSSSQLTDLCFVPGDFFSDGQICYQCRPGFVQSQDLLSCIDEAERNCPQNADPICQSPEKFCNYQSVMDGNTVLLPDEPAILVCPVGFCCATASEPQLVNFVTCEGACPSPTMGGFQFPLTADDEGVN